ncbi:hypothetical protein ACLB9X_04675 [Streptomyces sp. 5K101]|uniref:hypothetical protein n=1 Tax=Streptomyces sp. 5K101 TaxID=3390037 RepID=UPI0039768321
MAAPRVHENTPEPANERSAMHAPSEQRQLPRELRHETAVQRRLERRGDRRLTPRTKAGDQLRAGTGAGGVMTREPSRHDGDLTAAAATGNAAGYWFAGFFLVSTFFRPAGAYFTQLRRRLGVLLKDVTHPRDDVVELRAQVARLHAGTRVLEEKAEEQYRAIAELRRSVDALGVSVFARAARPIGGSPRWGASSSPPSTG